MLANKAWNAKGQFNQMKCHQPNVLLEAHWDETLKPPTTRVLDTKIYRNEKSHFFQRNVIYNASVK